MTSIEIVSIVEQADTYLCNKFNNSGKVDFHTGNGAISKLEFVVYLYYNLRQPEMELDHLSVRINREMNYKVVKKVNL